MTIDEPSQAQDPSSIVIPHSKEEQAVPADVDLRVRALLAKVLEVEPSYVRSLPAETKLFGSLSLDSLTGLELLAGVQAEFGVDIASEDLNLDSLDTIATLVGYLSSHSESPHTER